MLRICILEISPFAKKYIIEFIFVSSQAHILVFAFTSAVPSYGKSASSVLVVDSVYKTFFVRKIYWWYWKRTWKTLRFTTDEIKPERVTCCSNSNIYKTLCRGQLKKPLVLESTLFHALKYYFSETKLVSSSIKSINRDEKATSSVYSNCVSLLHQYLSVNNPFAIYSILCKPFKNFLWYYSPPITSGALKMAHLLKQIETKKGKQSRVFVKQEWHSAFWEPGCFLNRIFQSVLVRTLACWAKLQLLKGVFLCYFSDALTRYIAIAYVRRALSSVLE